ncbi:MAG: hypothetical protein E7112_03410 [Bacteroidales bacterium]|nr:hypothetical protein [Bacteroidales bacterium]
MRRLSYILVALFTLLSCSTFDHSAIWDELREHEERIEALEAQCRQLNSNVEALQAVLTALQEHDYITDIIKIMEDGVETGYSITFAKGGTITIYHGTDGTEGSAPKIGISKAADGEYYWTSDGEWLTDEDGEKIPAAVPDDPDGRYVTPHFRVSDGRWYVSYDGGNTWRPFDNVSDGLFSDVSYDNKYLYLTLDDGTELKVPIGTAKMVDLFIFMGQSNMSGFGGDASKAPEVPQGWGYEYKAISDPSCLVPMVEPFGLNEDNADSGVSNTKRAGTLVSAFTNAYYNRTEIPVVGVSCSRGSTDTWFWMPGGKPLEDAISRHQSAEEWLTENGYVIRNNFMVWLQGESDSALSSEQYKSNLIAITREMISRTGITECMIIRIGKNKSMDSSFDNVLQAQTELPKEYKEFMMASTLAAGFPAAGLMSDSLHYTQEGYNMLGEDAGTNVAFYATNGIEPYMYDPHYDNLYYPTGAYRSIFDLPETGEPQGVVYYELNKNINANDELVDYPGRIAILDYFESDGQQASVSSTFTGTFGLRYYDQEKRINGTYSNYTGSTYCRVVCVLNETETALQPNAYDGKTITINGITYLLQQRLEPKFSSVAFIGNSITAGVGASDNSHRYSTLLAGMLEAREINLGVSGTSLCMGGSRTCNFSKLTAENLGGAELVLIKMGINDWAAAKPEFYGLGEPGSDDTSTIYGATAMWCEKIVELKATDQYKNTKFYFITPIVTSWNNSVTSVRDYDQSKTNVHGFTLRELCEAIINTCEVYDIPVLDMNLESGIYYNSPEDDHASEYFGDGVHPNDAGHAKLAASLYTALLKML